jgi:protein-S-isoprenylcysteine O-methyltransferase Ste14
VDLMSGWRHARAIVLLPGMAAVVAPALILSLGGGVNVAPLPAVVGCALIAAGLAMWVWTVLLFHRIGQGTLAPWDPTRRLVVEGPYAHVRNPMITAVGALLLGEAALFGSTDLLIWWAVFMAINWLYFVVSEEPGLERRFGDEYRAYRQGVPRWIPRRTPWTTRGPSSPPRP